MSSVQKLVTDEDVFPTKYGMAASGAPWGAIGQVKVGLQHVYEYQIACSLLFDGV